MYRNLQNIKNIFDMPTFPNISGWFWYKTRNKSPNSYVIIMKASNIWLFSYLQSLRKIFQIVPPSQLSKRHEYMVSRLFIWKRCLKVTILLWTNLGWYPPDCIGLKNVCGGTKVPVIIFKNEIDILSYFWKKYIKLSKSRYIFKICSIFEMFSKKSRVIDLIFEKNNWISIFPKTIPPRPPQTHTHTYTHTH